VRIFSVSEKAGSSHAKMSANSPSLKAASQAWLLAVDVNEKSRYFKDLLKKRRLFSRNYFFSAACNTQAAQVAMFTFIHIIQLSQSAQC